MMTEWTDRCKVHRYRGCIVCPVIPFEDRLVRFPTLDNMSPDEYIRYAKEDNIGCPVCRSREVIYEDCNQSSGEVIDQTAFCRDCECSWQEEFHMVTYHSVKYKKEKVSA